MTCGRCEANIWMTRVRGCCLTLIDACVMRRTAAIPPCLLILLRRWSHRKRRPASMFARRFFGGAGIGRPCARRAICQNPVSPLRRAAGHIATGRTDPPTRAPSPARRQRVPARALRRPARVPNQPGRVRCSLDTRRADLKARHADLLARIDNRAPRTTTTESMRAVPVAPRRRPDAIAPSPENLIERPDRPRRSRDFRPTPIRSAEEPTWPALQIT
jgi:hypothetical protein